MKTALRYLIDATIGVLLVVAVGVVFRLDQPRAEPDEGPRLVEVAQEEPISIAPPPLRLAVTYCPRDRAEYDDMGRLLKELGQGYQYTPIHQNDLAEYDRIAQFDVIFVTCGTYPKEWLEAESLGKGVRPGTESRRMNRRMFDRARDALRRFVASGKTLYVSDQMYTLLTYAFEEFQDPSTSSSSSSKLGDRQTVEARVVDPGLRDQLGGELALRFDLPDWFPALFTSRDSTVFLEGSYRTLDGGTETAPLLVKLPFEQGALIFTSFHNEKQNSEKEYQLLKYLVFATVTAREVSKVTRTMLAGGFSPRKQSLLSASTESSSVTQSHRNRTTGRLQFVLGFEPRGARLRLKVVGPDGKVLEKEGTSTFTLTIDKPQVGDWTYSVTALQVPYENFPFTLTVGEE
jgi:hypothetical protein